MRILFLKLLLDIIERSNSNDLLIDELASKKIIKMSFHQ